MDKLLERIPPMLSGKELEDALAVFPEYKEEIREKSQTERLIALSDLYKVYVPNDTSKEIYNKLYLAMLRSLQKKQSRMATKQCYENYKLSKGFEYNGIMGGADSFSIIGNSGVGKSSCICRCIDLITDGKVIETEKPYNKIIPILQVQTPHDASVKGLLYEILRVCDERLDTKYYESAVKSASTVDKLIGIVSTIAINHIGVIVVDEIQNIVHNKNGINLVNVLTQLINASGISICMVGIPEVKSAFVEGQQLARRCLGVHIEEYDFGTEFRNLCNALFDYQYVKKKTELSEGMLQWVYEHSQGNISIVVFLIYNAQEIAILSGEEELNMKTLQEAYLKRMSFLHGYVRPRRSASTSKTKKSKLVLRKETVLSEDDFTIQEIVSKSKNTGEDIVELLKQYIRLESVKV